MASILKKCPNTFRVQDNKGPFLTPIMQIFNNCNKLGNTKATLSKVLLIKPNICSIHYSFIVRMFFQPILHLFKAGLRLPFHG
nr:hypothetical protein Iba_chr12cCG23190 [Ipomoea batatas]